MKEIYRNIKRIGTLGLIENRISPVSRPCGFLIMSGRKKLMATPYLNNI